MIEGIVIKGYSGFYYVQVGAKLWECSLRGRFRREKKNVLTGDHVLIEPANERQAVIDEIKPRKNELTRPPVANVDQAVLVFAVAEPSPDFSLIDRLLLLAEAEGLNAVLCFNKIDLDPDKVSELDQIYRPLGNKVLFTCGKSGEGTGELKALLEDKITFFAGPSGTGKSTLLNWVKPGLGLKTGAVSAKIGRGRHTTRHVELIPLSEGSFVADTPGFSNLMLPEIAVEDLDGYFPEFHSFLGQCRFQGCLHHKEPSCAVKDGLAKGIISPFRYQNYLQFLQELAERKKY